MDPRLRAGTTDNKAMFVTPAEAGAYPNKTFVSG